MSKTANEPTANRANLIAIACSIPLLAYSVMVLFNLLVGVYDTLTDDGYMVQRIMTMVLLVVYLPACLTGALWLWLAVKGPQRRVWRTVSIVYGIATSTYVAATIWQTN